jgi:dihydrofolate synthase/folylpolyglutamate synthase
LHQLCKLGSRPGLERIESLLQAMDNPQHGLNYIHVAGTNGKGSTSLIMADILIKAGYRVGRFSSPHLHSYMERFTVNGQEITAESFKLILDKIGQYIEVMLKRGEAHPTEFEVLTAIAFQYFRNEGVDIVVLEVGMGGSYDSTNVIVPLVAVITGVDFDHTAFLGNTLAEIASNKAGIIKPGVPVIVGMMADEALDVIKSRAWSLRAPLYLSSRIEITRVGKPTLEGQVLNIETRSWMMSQVKYSLLGDYQVMNLAAALSAMEVMKASGYRVEEHHIRQSLDCLKMPGRLEVVQQYPLVIVDAAHNAQGAQALADSLDTLLPARKKILVLGLLDDKERDGILNALGRNTRIAIITRPQGPRGGAWQEVQTQWQEIFPKIRSVAVENINEAVNKGLAMLSADEYLVITGSFYVLDQARRVFINN